MPLQFYCSASVVAVVESIENANTVFLYVSFYPAVAAVAAATVSRSSLTVIHVCCFTDRTNEWVPFGCYAVRPSFFSLFFSFCWLYLRIFHLHFSLDTINCTCILGELFAQHSAYTVWWIVERGGYSTWARGRCHEHTVPQKLLTQDKAANCSTFFFLRIFSALSHLLDLGGWVLCATVAVPFRVYISK